MVDHYDWAVEAGLDVGARIRAIGLSLSGIFAAAVPAEFDSEARKDFLSFRLGAVPAATGFSKLRSDYQEPLWLFARAVRPRVVDRLRKSRPISCWREGAPGSGRWRFD